MMGISFDLGLPGLFHKWGDARMRRALRKMRRNNRELKAEIEDLRDELRDVRRHQASRARQLKRAANRG